MHPLKFIGLPGPKPPLNGSANPAGPPGAPVLGISGVKFGGGVLGPLIPGPMPGGIGGIGGVGIPPIPGGLPGRLCLLSLFILQFLSTKYFIYYIMKVTVKR